MSRPSLGIVPGSRWIVVKDIPNPERSYKGQIREVTRCDNKVGVLWIDITDPTKTEEQTTSQTLFAHICRPDGYDKCKPDTEHHGNTDNSAEAP